MPAKSKQQFKYIWALRNKYKTKSRAPKKTKWAFKSGCTSHVNYKKLPKKVSESLESFLFEKVTEQTAETLSNQIAQTKENNTIYVISLEFEGNWVSIKCDALKKIDTLKRETIEKLKYKESLNAYANVLLQKVFNVEKTDKIPLEKKIEALSKDEGFYISYFFYRILNLQIDKALKDYIESLFQENIASKFKKEVPNLKKLFVDNIKTYDDIIQLFAQYKTQKYDLSFKIKGLQRFSLYVYDFLTGTNSYEKTEPFVIFAACDTEELKEVYENIAEKV